MNGTMLQDAFGHHVWASVRLLDVCATLTHEQLETAVPGTYGSIIGTMRHCVGADYWYLSTMSPGSLDDFDEDAMDIAALRAAVEATAAVWTAVLDQELDPDEILLSRGDDGIQSSAPLSIRLAQALHHGTDHRSQVCTALTALGIEPPQIDAWAYAWKDGRLIDLPPGG